MQGYLTPNLVRGCLLVLCGCWNGSVARLKPCPWAQASQGYPGSSSKVMRAPPSATCDPCSSTPALSPSSKCRATGTCSSSFAPLQSAAPVLYLVRFPLLCLAPRHSPQIFTVPLPLRCACSLSVLTSEPRFGTAPVPNTGSQLYFL